jgi:GT2 family glycosyltransferase
MGSSALQNGGSNSTPPLVSVIIPYYRRGEVFDRCLDSVLRQDYARREVIVVDNHSEDDVRERIEARRASVVLIQLPYNQGACAARNAGIRASQGEILAILDDDVGFMSSSELTKLVELFQARPEVHVVAFQICDAETGELRLRDWCHPRDWKRFSDCEFETHHFGEGSSAFRRQVFDVVGLYHEPFFYGAEGHDMEIRVLNHGFRILYSPRVRVWHQVAEASRSVQRQYYYFTRNYVWMAYKDYPFAAGLRFLAEKLAMMFYFTVRLGCFGAFFSGLWDGFRGLGHLRAVRTPASRETLRYWAKLERDRPGLIARLARHREGPQL